MVISPRPEVVSDKRRFTIVADDMTGACDAAVPFAQRGLRTLVLTGERIPDGLAADVVAISTETRDVAPELLSGLLQQHLEQIGKRGWQGEIFKKIDSALRGNTIAEIVAFWFMFPSQVLALASAFPALKRTMRNGVQRIDNRSAHHNVDVLAALHGAGIRAERFDRGVSSTRMRESVVASMKTGTRVLLFDAEMQGDLTAAVEALEPLGNALCWVGSGGLAHALADVTVSQVACDVERVRRGRVIFVVGSDHAATQAQLRHLQTEHRIAECVSVDRCPADSLVVCMVRRGTPPEATSSFFSDIEPKDVGCIFITGGDTVSHLCRALNVVAIEIHREFAHGVPVGTLRGGLMDGVRVITKSGGFGESNLLSSIASEYSKEVAVVQ